MTDIRVIVDEDLKYNAETVLSKLDLTMSQAVRMFLKQVVKEEELPFNPYAKKFNTKTESAIKKSKNRKNLIKHKNLETMFKTWNKN
jgi:DNA-damage-inducible protein J